MPNLARVLSRAFFDDPITEFMLPDERTRLARNARGFRVILRQQFRRGHPVHVTASGTSVAVWVPPDEWKAPRAEIVRAGLPFLLALRTRMAAAMRGFAMLEAAHPRRPPHWYLAVLGTDPEHQGKGHGSKVMAPMLDRCDAEGVHAFLESSKASNIPFYERHGFRVVREIAFGRDGPPLWQMFREPQPT